jgi:very-short-patch-repair endonuclease
MRMRAHNPMMDEATRTKMSMTLKEIGHGPKRRGGNGRGPTVPQAELARLTGLAIEHAIQTKVPRGQGYPTCYKVDLADVDLCLAVEIDGATHSGKQKAIDAKKDAFLASCGWTVLRFSNEEVMEHSEACAAMVASTTSRLRARIPISSEPAA